MKANMKDVALRANVSIATVSRFLNGKKNKMSIQTANRVKKAIDDLEYVPNAAARKLITNSSRIIAVMAAEVDDYFSTEMFKGISSILENENFVSILFDSDSDKSREAQLLKKINDNLFDGLIIQPLSNDVDFIKSHVDTDFPIVVVDRELKNSPWPSVVTNNFEISQTAMKEFKKEGYTKAIIISEKIPGISTREQRDAGVRSVFPDATLIEASSNINNSTELYTKLLNKLKNCNEKTVIISLKERHLLRIVPKLIADGVLNDSNKIAITGFADTKVIPAINSNIRLINQNPFLIGASAAEIIMDSVGNTTNITPKKTIIPAKF